VDKGLPALTMAMAELLLDYRVGAGGISPEEGKTIWSWSEVGVKMSCANARAGTQGQKQARARLESGRVGS
jgi:hypothetical protein